MIVFAGLSTLDLVQRVDELPSPGEKTRARSVAMAAGGPAANAAVAAAALGESARLLTVLGAHPLARIAEADLRAQQVDPIDLLAGYTAPPPVSSVVVRDWDGERTVVSRDAGDIPAAPAPDRLPAGTRAVLVDGHHGELALTVARQAGELGIPVVLDAGSWKPVLDELVPLVDVVACSAAFRVPDGTPDLLSRGATTVIRTAGPDPVRWWSGDRSGEVAVPLVEAVDTLGAGDIWHGAFTVALADRRTATLSDPTADPAADPTELVRFANAVAAERVRHAGPRAWVGPVRDRWRAALQDAR